MNVDKINYLNIGLMLVSLLVAYIFPFELLIFSYAFLGPAHYLTEISWLHDRGYFTTGRRDYVALVLLTAPITFLATDSSVGAACLWVALAAAFGMAFFENKWLRSTLLVGLALLIFFLDNIGITNFLYLFIPTLIHVFVFTGAFILVGSLKSKSVSGHLSLVVFVLCALSFFFHSPAATSITGASESSFKLWNTLRMYIALKLNLSDSPETTAAIMGFLSYAYTYHYLNWFSKTEIIRWHQVSKQRLALIITIYLAAVALYLYDYQLGYTALLFLSMLHVVLEFPLNYQCFRTIGVELKLLRARKDSSSVALTASSTPTGHDL